MITIIQVREGWDCLVSDRPVGRIAETSTGFELSIEGGEPRGFADLNDAQGAFMDIYDPGWREEEARSREEVARRAAVELAAAVPPRAVRAKRQVKPWHGPKQGTHYARAESIRDAIHKYDYVQRESRWDHRGRSPGHAEAYELACEAVSLLADAQGFSRHPSLRREEGKARARAARLLAKAEKLMPEIGSVSV